MSFTFLPFSGIAVTFRPDGQELAVASLNGEITFWDLQTAAQTGAISGRSDLQMGRKETEKISAKQSAKGKYVYSTPQIPLSLNLVVSRKREQLISSS